MAIGRREFCDDPRRADLPFGRDIPEPGYVSAGRAVPVDCKERGDDAIPRKRTIPFWGLLRFARNDGSTRRVWSRQAYDASGRESRVRLRLGAERSGWVDA